MNNVAFRITAVPERFENATREKNAIPGSLIYLDSEHRGNIWNKFRVYEDAIKDGSFTHVCMNDDDLIIPENFSDAVNAIVSRFPESIFTFYNSKIGGSSPKIVKMQSHYMNGASCVIPCSLLPGFLAFYRDNLRGFKWDDTAMSIYALLNDIDVLLVIPKLVDVVHMESTLPMRRGKFQPKNAGDFVGRIADVKAICTAPVVIGAKSMFNTHLPDGHPVKIMCQEKWRALKKWK